MTPEQEQKTWQYRALAYCHASQSQVGLFLIAMLGRKRLNGPTFHTYGYKITTDGRVLIPYRSGPNGQWRIENIWSVAAMVGLFRGLCEALKLTDAERIAMFDELRKFCISDARAVSGIEPSDKPRKELIAELVAAGKIEVH